MRLSQRVGRRSVRNQNLTRAAVAASVIDTLESRQLFSGETISSTISPILANLTTPSSNSITLNQHFTDSTIPGTVATFNTSLGIIKVALTDAATPLTVANFLSYVNSGAYTNTIFHRSANLTAGTGGTPSSPADIIQGGGYVVQGLALNHIPTGTPVHDEYTTEVEGDVAGTLAMAKTSSANSATSEWYFNVHNNTELDPPTTDSNGVTTSYTVFGIVLSGENVVDKIAALPTYNVATSVTSSALTTLPVLGLTEGQATKDKPITANNLVYTRSITSEPGTTYTVTSDNSTLVTPTVANGVLSFKYASGIFGTANITIVAKNLDGTSATTTFSVTVPNSATATAGPTAAAVTAPNTIEGKSSTFSVLGGATDSVAALDPTKVAIVTQPTNGTATVDATTGLITYTPPAGYTGSDTLSYTVTDTAGTVSSPATVTLDVVPAPVTVTIGTRLTKSLTFTQPSGAVGRLSIKGGIAVVTFASDQVTTTTTNGVVTATGAGATISSVTISNTGASASLSLISTGAVTLGSVTDAKHLSVLNAPNATLTGNSSFGSISRLITAGATDAYLSLGSGASTALVLPNVADSTVTSDGSISSLTSRQWLVDDGGYHVINAASIGRLNVGGTFAELLNLTATGAALGSAVVGQADNAWTIAGSASNVILRTPASAWSLNATGTVGSLKIVGNLTNTITAGSLGTLNVTGTTTSATITTNANFFSDKIEIGKMRFNGAVTSSFISSVGNIGAITAASLTGSHIDAGIEPDIVTSGALAASITDLLVNAKIGSVTLGRGTTAFSNSRISAYDLGSLRLGNVATSNSGTTLGVAAQKINSISAKLIPGGVINAGPKQLKTVATLSAYENKKKVTLGDFVISIITT